MIRNSLILTFFFAAVTTWHSSAAYGADVQQVTSAHQGIQPYTQPGIVSYKAGRWIGNDHLYNLSTDIHVVAETIIPGAVTLPITGDSVRTRAEALFRKSGINPFSPSEGAEAVLPFLHILLTIYPVDGVFAAACNVRLFESIQLPRVQIEGGVAWQGITWEKQKLVVAPQAEMEKQLSAAVDSILNDFIKRYVFYQKLKSYLKEKK